MSSAPRPSAAACSWTMALTPCSRCIGRSAFRLTRIPDYSHVGEQEQHLDPNGGGYPGLPLCQPRFESSGELNCPAPRPLAHRGVDSVPLAPSVSIQQCPVFRGQCVDPLADQAAEQGSESSAKELSESAGGVGGNEAQCPPRGNDHDAQKGHGACHSTRLMPRR